jgi:hypothetical protein
MADWGSTRAAIGSLGTRTQGVVALSLIALPAQAAGTVYIQKAYYSSPGAGERSNSSLTAEYAVIRNVDSSYHAGRTVPGCGGSPL